MSKNRLKELRKEHKLTLKELSQELEKKGIKVTHSQLGYWEKGERSPRNTDMWKNIANFFNVLVNLRWVKLIIAQFKTNAPTTIYIRWLKASSGTK